MAALDNTPCMNCAYLEGESARPTSPPHTHTPPLVLGVRLLLLSMMGAVLDGCSSFYLHATGVALVST